MELVVGEISIRSGSDATGVRSFPWLLLEGADADGNMGIIFACGGRWSAEKAGRGIDSVVAMVKDSLKVCYWVSSGMRLYVWMGCGKINCYTMYESRKDTETAPTCGFITIRAELARKGRSAEVRRADRCMRKFPIV